MTNQEKQALIERINIAIKEFTCGRASMHVPPLDTDVDIVLADCEKMITELAALTAQPVNLSSCRTLWYDHDDLSAEVKCIPVKDIKKAIRAAGYAVRE